MRPLDFIGATADERLKGARGPGLHGLYSRALSVYRSRTQLRPVRPEELNASEESPVSGRHQQRRRRSGLYHRALEHRQKSHLRPARPEDKRGDQAEDNVDGISAEERREIAARIDGIVSRSHIEVSPETLAYKAKRSGAVLPLLCNLGVLAVVAVAIFLSSRFLNRQEQTLASGKETVLTAESQVVAELKQESAQQLQQKDQAIASIQQKLQSVSQEREQLRTQADTIIQQKAQQLQAQYDQRLADERARLQKQGVSQAVMDTQLAQLEQSEKKKYDDSLAAAKAQAEADVTAKDQQISAISAQYAKDLAAAQQDKQKLQDQLAQKQADLQNQFQQRQQQLESDTAKVTAQLAQLQKDRAQEQLVLDQIQSGYDRVNRSLAAANYPQALQDLDSLRSYIGQSSVAALAAVQRRRDVDMFLIGSLEELVTDRQSAASPETAAMLEASAQLKAVSDLVDRGDALSRTGDLAGAKDAYLTALGKIPSVNRGYAQLEAMRKAGDDKQTKQVVDSLTSGNVFFQAGDYQGSLQRYRQGLNLLLKNDTLSRQLTDNVMNAGYRILAADEINQLHQLQADATKRQALVARIQSLRDQYKAFTTTSQASGPSSPESVAALLQAKVLVRLLLDSEPLRSQYPGLGASLDKYFAALSDQGRAEGKAAALADVRGMLDALVTKAPPQVSNLSQYAAAGQTDPVLALLDLLEKLAG